MKLIFCPDCQDIRKIGHNNTYCACGASYGRYLDDINAEYGGLALPFGMSNPSLYRAFRMYEEGKVKTVSVMVEAFLIPEDCETFVKIPE